MTVPDDLETYYRGFTTGFLLEWRATFERDRAEAEARACRGGAATAFEAQKMVGYYTARLTLIAHILAQRGVRQ